MISDQIKMNNEIIGIIKKQISIFKSKFPNTSVKIKEFGEYLFLLHDKIDVIEDESYQQLIYDFSMEYFNNGYFGIFWATGDFD